MRFSSIILRHRTTSVFAKASPKWLLSNNCCIFHAQNYCKFDTCEMLYGSRIPNEKQSRRRYLPFLQRFADRIFGDVTPTRWFKRSIFIIFFDQHPAQECKKELLRPLPSENAFFFFRHLPSGKLKNHENALLEPPRRRHVAKDAIRKSLQKWQIPPATLFFVDF